MAHRTRTQSPRSVQRSRGDDHFVGFVVTWAVSPPHRPKRILPLRHDPPTPPSINVMLVGRAGAALAAVPWFGPLRTSFCTLLGLNATRLNRIIPKIR